MAQATLATYEDSLAVMYAALVKRQTNRQGVLLRLIQKPNGAGKNCAWDVTFDGMSGNSEYTEGDEIVSGDLQNDVEEQAILSWGTMREAFGITSLAAAGTATAGSNTPAELTDVIMKKAMESGSKLQSNMNIALYTGTSKIIGLDTAIDDAGTYATLSKVTYSEWQGTVLANGGTPRALTKALLDEMDQQMFTKSGRKASVIITSPAVAKKYEALLDAIARVRLSTGDVSPLKADGGGIQDMGISDGFTGLDYAGIPIYRDKDAPDQLQFLSLADIEFRSLPANPKAGAIGYVERMLTDDHGQSSGVQVRFERLGNTGNNTKWNMYSLCQLVVNHPNRHGRIEDITV